MSDKISVLLLGLGRISSTLEKDHLRYHPCTHAGVLLNSVLKNNFLLKGIFDPNMERIENFILDWKLEPNKISTDMQSISNTKFDLCVIASNSESHFENIKFASSLGIKYILVEKPICINGKELNKIEKLTKLYNLHIWVNHERRYHPIYRYVKENLDSGRWGKIKTIHASVLTSSNAPGNAYTGKGPLLHDGTHAIDFLDFLLGAPKKIHFSEIERYAKYSMEKRAIALLEYEGKIFIFLETGGERNYFQFEITIETTEGKFRLSNDGHEFFISQESELYNGFRSLKKIDLPEFNSHLANPWISIYQEIINHFTKKNVLITGSFAANKRIFKTLERIYSKSKST